MKNTRIRNSLFLFVAVLVAACSSTKKIAVTIRNAPMIKAPVNTTVGVVNRAAAEKSSQLYVETDFLYEGAARDGSNAFCDGITRVLTKNNSFNILPVVYAGTNENIHHDPVNTTIVEAESWIKELGCNVLIVVDYFFADFQKEVSESEALNADGESVFKAEMIGRVESSISVFVVDSTGNILALEPLHREDNTLNSAEGNKPGEAKKALPAKRSIVSGWGDDFGSDVGYGFMPNEYNVKRLFFIAGNSELKDAWKNVKNGNFAIATKILKEVTNTSDFTLKAKSLFNLAVVAECMGNINLAINLIEQSLAIVPMPEAYSYKADLEYLVR
ncbi:MAG: hypothetical protein CVU11_00095 [Bacteroidetes bacterium HGW-Bacteroidetes-6]|jgi:hypothetical protein|nr:MAG: hypothetical protein CVU11_00095 [Bacteroidetes bacterium HGW-Bacteroidetes-6]